jgi:hypothetical protein
MPLNISDDQPKVNSFNWSKRASISDAEKDVGKDRKKIRFLAASPYRHLCNSGT